MGKKKLKDGEKGKKSSLIIILLLLIAAVACALAGYTFYEMKKMKSNSLAGMKKPAVAVAPVVPIYVPMDTFTVSLSPSAQDSDRVLYIGLTLRVKNDDSKAVLEQFLPEVRSRIFVLLAHETANDVSTDEGKAQLIEKIKAAIGKPLAPNRGAIVTDVLFNAFIIR